MRDGSPLSIFAATVNSNIIVRLEGQLDLTNYVQLSASIVKFAGQKPRALIIDVSDVKTSDSSPCALFTDVQSRLSHLPALRVALVCVKDRAVEAIQRMSLSRDVAIFPTIEAAVRAVAEDS
jgi:anti-anti-sigma factor